MFITLSSLPYKPKFSFLFVSQWLSRLADKKQMHMPETKALLMFD